MSTDLNLNQLIWDYNISEEEINKLLAHQVKDINGFTLDHLYVRMLTSYSWYTLIKNLDRLQLKEALSDEVIKKVFPKQLQEKFLYARRFL